MHQRSTNRVLFEPGRFAVYRQQPVKLIWPRKTKDGVVWRVKHALRGDEQVVYQDELRMWKEWLVYHNAEYVGPVYAGTREEAISSAGKRYGGGSSAGFIVKTLREAVAERFPKLPASS